MNQSLSNWTDIGYYRIILNIVSHISYKEERVTKILVAVARHEISENKVNQYTASTLCIIVEKPYF